jgi:hypothetical protein
MPDRDGCLVSVVSARQIGLAHFGAYFLFPLLPEVIAAELQTAGARILITPLTNRHAAQNESCRPPAELTLHGRTP